jgi:hypothetical protein
MLQGALTHRNVPLASPTVVLTGHAAKGHSKDKLEATSLAWSNAWQKPSRKKGLHDVSRSGSL